MGKTADLIFTLVMKNSIARETNVMPKSQNYFVVVPFKILNYHLKSQLISIAFCMFGKILW